MNNTSKSIYQYTSRADLTAFSLNNNLITSTLLKRPNLPSQTSKWRRYVMRRLPCSSSIFSSFLESSITICTHPVSIYGARIPWRMQHEIADVFLDTETKHSQSNCIHTHACTILLNPLIKYICVRIYRVI